MDPRIAPCGIDCINCEVHKDNITETLRQTLAAALRRDPERVPCHGCRQEKGCRLQFQTCPTLDCVQAKGVTFCHECPDFPCAMLQPASERADKLPHNLKVFNLCRIKAVGVERFLAEEAQTIRAKYYRGKMVVGKGPVLEP